MTLNHIVIGERCQASTIDGISNISGQRIVYEAFIEQGCLIIGHLSNSYNCTVNLELNYECNNFSINTINYDRKFDVDYKKKKMQSVGGADKNDKIGKGMLCDRTDACGVQSGRRCLSGAETPQCLPARFRDAPVSFG